MLVLSRKEGEELLIGDGIRVTVCDVRNGSVRLGITADPSIAVARAELHRERCQNIERRPSVPHKQHSGLAGAQF